MGYSGIIRSCAKARLVRTALLAIICAIVGGLATPALAASLRHADTLPAPTNLQAAPGKDHISLQWDAVPGVRVNYNIYRGTKSHGETLYYQGDANTTFTNTKIVKGTVYYYQVTAVDAQGTESPRSAEVAASSDKLILIATPLPASSTTPTQSHDYGFILWLLLGFVSLAMICGGVFLIWRQHQGQPAFAGDDTGMHQSGVFAAAPLVPQNETPPGPFAPRSWDALSPEERAGIFPPAQTDTGRPLGAVAFWDEQRRQSLIPDDDQRQRWSYPNPQSWPPQDD
jgi:hypothetical protein